VLNTKWPLEYDGEPLTVLELSREDDVHVSRRTLVSMSGNRVATDDDEANVALDERDEQLPLVRGL
jgi:hypothetical protein